ncbi:hypothetical protein ANANG_G00186220 [Anguilla anguilla]|uniref:BTB domain-containing protein n=1 Tax=Anguilla anguilla TaxID=7936 RepID=A0A9D3M3N3_ANGAN|nr:hypothetical protein ANANG_G00186220 [Anguilla anguilla]
MELPNHAKQILLQLNQQRAKGFLCDVIIVVENALFRAHKNILAASSIYFKSLVLHDNLINLDTEMVNPSVFRQILDFIYTGKLLSSEPSSEQNFTALLTAASYLQLHDLAALCRKKLKRNGRVVPGKPSAPGGRPRARGCRPRPRGTSASPGPTARASPPTTGSRTSCPTTSCSWAAACSPAPPPSAALRGRTAAAATSARERRRPGAGPGPVQEEPVRQHRHRGGEPQQPGPGVPQSACASTANSASFEDSAPTRRAWTAWSPWM